MPAEGLLLAVEQQLPDGRWGRVAWDDQSDVEVSVNRDLGKRGYEWQIHYDRISELTGQTLRVHLPERQVSGGLLNNLYGPITTCQFPTSPDN